MSPSIPPPEPEAAPTEDATPRVPAVVVTPPQVEAGAPDVDVPRCANCGTVLLGATCHACGQPTKGLIRQFSSILGDFFDTVLSIDSRTLRTIVPLYFWPGFLSNEYFAGRRVRYVTPLRLYFFLSVLAFVVISAITQLQTGDTVRFGKGADSERIAKMSPAERERKIAEVEKAVAFLPEAQRAQIRSEMQAELAAADQQVAKRKAREEAKAKARAAAPTGQAPTGQAPTDPASAEPAPPAPPAPPAAPQASAAGTPEAPPNPNDLDVDLDEDGKVSFNGQPWDPKTNPLKFGWLTDGMNASLNAEIGALIKKAKGLNKDPAPFVKQIFSLAPQALFVILPLFALLLKLFYVFKRRLYMEHLIVALHSHSFICLSLILIIALNKIHGWTEGIALLPSIVNFALIAAWCWVFVYIFLMQKRVYRQGWIMTGLKFFTIGSAYLVLLTCGMLATMLVSLVLL